MIAIKDCKYFEEGILRQSVNVLLNEDKIAELTSAEIPGGYEVIDAHGGYLTPGFIDLQIYGSGRDLFSAFPSRRTLKQMDADLITKGTTGFMACVATNSMEIVRECIEAAKAYQPEAKAFLGLHLEGPYLNPKRLGAHVPAYVHKATLLEVKSLVEQAEGTIKIMTIAAELQDDEVIAYLLSQGIVLSLGHSDANFEEATAAYNRGFTTTTHLFNAMPSIHHRAPNLPSAVFNHPTAMASIIADGKHVDFEMVNISYRLLKERLFLITDSVTPCKIGPYQHQLEGEIFVTPNGTLSGSIITMLDAVRNCVKYCQIPLSDALNMASLHPAKVISQQDKLGKIAVGMKADLLILNEQLALEKVFVSGVVQLMYDNKNK
jgi:N-acetylglucosamine-6-phosphate deacetylase